MEVWQIILLVFCTVVCGIIVISWIARRSI